MAQDIAKTIKRLRNRGAYPLTFGINIKILRPNSSKVFALGAYCPRPPIAPLMGFFKDNKMIWWLQFPTLGHAMFAKSELMQKLLREGHNIITNSTYDYSIMLYFEDKTNEEKNNGQSNSA